jgi:tetratricopeptide (TPR) repeat protein
MRRSVLLAVAMVILGGMLFSNRIVKASQYSELLLSQGIGEMGRGEYEKAVEWFKRAAEREPRDPEVHYYLGLAYSRLGDYPSAITAFERVLKLDPKDRKVRYEMGIASYFMGDYPKAMASFKMAQRDDPSNTLVPLYLGATYQQLGKHRRSIRYFLKARELDPEVAQMSEFYLAMAYMGMGRNKEAAEALRACIEMNPASEVAAMARDYVGRVPEREKPERRWNVSGTLSFQYDDNVILKPEGVTTAELITDESDFRGVGFFWGEYRFLQGAPWVGGLRYSLYQSVHTRLHDYDITNNAASLYWGYGGEVKGLPYKAQLDYEYQHTLLNNTRYLARHSGIFKLDFSETSSLLTRLTYRGQKKHFYKQEEARGTAEDRNSFNHKAGLTQYLSFSEKTRHIHGGYFFDRDDADGNNWDYTGHLASAGFSTPLTYGVRLRARGEYYWQNFDHTHTTFLVKRKDKEGTLHVSLDRDFGKYLNLSAYYVHQRHHSNLDVFKYNRNIYFLSVTGRF